MNPQETHAAVVEMLRTSGLPMTTDNLNRAMQAVARGEMLQPQADASAGVERSIQRVMQPRQLPIPPTPPVSLEQAVNTATAGSEQPPVYVPPVIEQTPQAMAGNDPGVMYDAMPESYVSQRRGTLQRPRYEGDTGPAADWPGRDIDPNAVGTILLMSPLVGAGASAAINTLRAAPKMTPRWAGEAADPFIRGGAKTNTYRGEAVDDFVQGANIAAKSTANQASNVTRPPMYSRTTINGKPTTVDELKANLVRRKQSKSSNADRKASKSD